MGKLLFYEIDSAYIDYLSQFAEHFFHNAKATQHYSLKSPASEPNAQYRTLLNNEIRIIKQKTEQILQNAKAVYDHKLTNDGKSKLAQRCNDFRLLEEKCRVWKIH